MTANTTADYTPSHGSVPARVCNYLATRPDVPSLDAEAVADLFGTTPNGVHTQLRKAVDAGLLKRTESREDGIVYTATPKLRQSATGRAGAAPPANHSGHSPRNGTTKRPARQLVNLLALPVETDVPAPTGPTTTRFDYAAVLDRLGEKGQSFVVPGNAMGLHPLLKTITERNKAGTHHYTVRTEPTGAMRIWRTG